MIKSIFLTVLLAGFWGASGRAQTRIPADSSGLALNMDAAYNRPFLQIGKIPVALGGYAEMKAAFNQTDGISEGFSFQMQRLTLFVSSSIHPKIKFLAEIEFEEGAKAINLEFASIDTRFHPLFNLRGGIIMNPIGAFNQNHDGPKWEFNDRPIAAAQMLPATWSNVGMGLFGKHVCQNWVLAYEAYLTNGFDDQIIANAENKTFLPAAKINSDRFGESFNGKPLMTAKIAVRNRKIGEIGLSYMGGVFNKFEEDRLRLDKKRRVHVWAVDFNATLPGLKTVLTGEWAWVQADVPESYSQQFGNRQHGGFLDLVQPICRGRMLGFDKAVLNLALRLEYVDWNAGRFRETGGNIGDEVFAFAPAISFRPSAAQTVFRFNYRYIRQRDLLGNPPARTAGFQMGMASYF
ncbi:MAG: hypothetical protein IPM81_13000 [Saprospirales bacterium]|nr:hypothetical protein [Saprospirales bacterium]